MRLAVLGPSFNKWPDLKCHVGYPPSTSTMLLPAIYDWKCIHRACAGGIVLWLRDTVFLLQHVIGAAAPRSLCQRRNTRGRTRTSGKTWCLAALASIRSADCSSAPFSAASQPSSPSLVFFDSSFVPPGDTVWLMLLQSTALTNILVNNWTSSNIQFILLQLLLMWFVLFFTYRRIVNSLWQCDRAQRDSESTMLLNEQTRSLPHILTDGALTEILMDAGVGISCLPIF